MLIRRTTAGGPMWRRIAALAGRRGHCRRLRWETPPVGRWKPPEPSCRVPWSGAGSCERQPPAPFAVVPAEKNSFHRSSWWPAGRASAHGIAGRRSRGFRAAQPAAGSLADSSPGGGISTPERGCFSRFLKTQRRRWISAGKAPLPTCDLHNQHYGVSGLNVACRLIFTKPGQPNREAASTGLD